ncbi:hypothetical protein OFN30_33140, partial [Escherichia coli]|nr:hypothetical protein [Escherichia coli]
WPWVLTAISATRKKRSASASEDPPNFNTLIAFSPCKSMKFNLKTNPTKRPVLGGYGPFLISVLVRQRINRPQCHLWWYR